jgi:hypothetical protein
VQQEGPVGGVDHAHALDGVDGGGDRLPLLLVGGVDGDVAQQLVLRDLDEVDGADDPAGLADRARYLTEHARAVGDLDADGQRVLGRRRDAHGPEHMPGGRLRR